MNRLVCYGITDDKLRKKIDDKLIHYGLTRVQYSVFIGYVADPHYTRMKDEIKTNLEENSNDTDSVIFMPLHQDQIKSMIVFGSLQDERNYILNIGNTIII